MEFIKNKGVSRGSANELTLIIHQKKLKTGNFARYIQIENSTARALDLKERDEICFSFNADKKRIELMINPNFNVESFSLKQPSNRSRMLTIRNRPLAIELINFLELSTEKSFYFNIKLMKKEYKNNKLYKLKLID